jgi:hypothetical protein
MKLPIMQFFFMLHTFKYLSLCSVVIVEPLLVSEMMSHARS